MPAPRLQTSDLNGSTRRTSRWLIVGVVLATLFALAWNPVYTQLRAVAVLLRIESSDAHGFFANTGIHPIKTQEAMFELETRQLHTRIYLPKDVEHAPALLIVHGVHRLGYNETRLVRFAKAMSGAGLVVGTPNLPELADYEIKPVSIDEIAAAATDLAQRMHTSCVGVLGLSFAGGLALQAASDPGQSQHICYVVAIGAHDDMARVMKFFATDKAEYPDGSTQEMKAHEYGVLVAIYAHPEDYFSKNDVAVARDAIRAQLYEQGAKARQIALKLSPQGQKAMMPLLAGNDDGAKQVLMSDLEKHRAEMEAVSPETTLYQIHVPVLLLHGAGDNVVPPSETLWLAKDLPSGRAETVLISPAISHVELGKGATIGDKWKLVRFVVRMLGEAKEAPYNTVELRRIGGSAVLPH